MTTRLQKWLGERVCKPNLLPGWDTAFGQMKCNIKILEVQPVPKWKWRCPRREVIYAEQLGSSFVSDTCDV